VKCDGPHGIGRVLAALREVAEHEAVHGMDPGERKA
jgi:hypothetical protein